MQIEQQEIEELTTTTKLTTDNKQKATSKTACDARGQKNIHYKQID